MNHEWMRERLERFAAMCDAYDHDEGYLVRTQARRELQEVLVRAAPTVRQILEALQVGLGANVTGVADSMRGLRPSRTAALTGIGILDDMDEVAVNLVPDAPSLVADAFHPHVWKAASAIWDTANYRVAVEQACVSLSTHIATKAGSHLTERKLVNAVFSPDEPTAAQARLHLPGDKRSDTWKSQQSGLHLIAQGAFAGIRNVSTHTSGDWPEHEALEHLAVLSLVAHWTDETTLASA